MGIYIPRARREQLRKYVYSSTDKSLVSKYILGPYWTWLVTLFPLGMAPNLITLLGLVCVFINFATLVYFNPTLSCGSKPLHVSKGGVWDPWFTPIEATTTFAGWSSWFGLAPIDLSPCAPRWLYFTFAVGLFVYQSLDAIDGKQARRTGTSGPLGELFDHGCDALNTTLEVILSASALNLGLSWWTVAALVATNANFYLTTWEEYHTGNLFLSAFSGPVEGILLIVLVFTVTGFQGPSFWDQGVISLSGLNSIPAVAALHIKDLPLNDLFMIFSTLGLLVNILNSTMNVYHSLPAATRTPSSILKPLTRLIPYALHTLSMTVWLAAQQEILHTTLLIPFFIFWGITFAHHVGLLILAHLTKSPFPASWKHPLLLLSMLGAMDANASRFGYRSFGHGDHESVKWTVSMCVVAATVVYGHFVWEVVGDICEFYDMNCLTIKKKVNKAQ